MPVSTRKPQCNGPQSRGNGREPRIGRPRSRRSAVAAFLRRLVPGLVLAGATAAQGAQWTPELSVSVTETYTDNAQLEADSRARSDFITELSPRISIRGSAARFNGFLSYSPQLILFARDSSESRIDNRLNALGTLEAIDNFFFIEGRGNVSQEFQSPFGPRPGDSVNATDNRAETYVFGISPYVRGVTPSGINYLARYDADWSNSEASLGSFRQAGSVRVSSPVRILGWSADYTHTDIKFENQPSQTSDLGRALLLYAVTPELQLNARGGYEQNDFGFSDRDGAIYGGGLDWRPSPRTTVAGFWEHRFFGTSFDARVEHRTRLTAWRLGASRIETTTPQQLFGTAVTDVAAALDPIFAAAIPDPVQRQAVIAQFLRQNGLPAFIGSQTRLITQQVFIRERFDASAAVRGVRNTVVLTVFRDENTPLTASGALPAAAFLFDSPIRQTGGALSYSLRVTPISSVNATYTKIRSDEEGTFNQAARKSNEDRIEVTYSTQLAPKTSGFVGLRYRRFDSDASGFSDFTEHAAFLGVVHRF